jgi:hypothetical protein
MRTPLPAIITALAAERMLDGELRGLHGLRWLVGEEGLFRHAGERGARVG